MSKSDWANKKANLSKDFALAVEQDIFKIVVTGPESSGKTTLAEQLASALGVPHVPEFARSYVAYAGSPYKQADLKKIALGQQLWENWYSQTITSSPSTHSSLSAQTDSSAMLVCDTDWTVIRIWEQFRYGTTDATTPPPALPALHLVCTPDFPWQPDPLRENPHDRMALLTLYLDLLRSIGANFHLLQGDPATRLEMALRIIREYS